MACWWTGDWRWVHAACLKPVSSLVAWQHVTVAAVCQRAERQERETQRNKWRSCKSRLRCSDAAMMSCLCRQRTHMLPALAWNSKGNTLRRHLAVNQRPSWQINVDLSQLHSSVQPASLAQNSKGNTIRRCLAVNRGLSWQTNVELSQLHSSVQPASLDPNSWKRTASRAVTSSHRCVRVAMATWIIHQLDQCGVLQAAVGSVRRWAAETALLLQRR